MPGTWTIKTIASQNITRADDFNQEAAGALGQFNGMLDQNNMPLESVDEVIVADNTLYSYNTTTGTIGAFSAHYVCGPYEDVLDFSVVSANLFAGWVRVDDDLVAEFSSKEGMLIGSVTIAGEKQSTEYTDGATVEFGANYFFSFGVFVNDVLVAETGKIFAHKYTVDLPFSCPIGNGDCVIDVRYIAPPVGERISSGIPNPDVMATPFKVYNRFIWCRNCYR